MFPTVMSVLLYHRPGTSILTINFSGMEKEMERENVDLSLTLGTLHRGTSELLKCELTSLPKTSAKLNNVWEIQTNYSYLALDMELQHDTETNFLTMKGTLPIKELNKPSMTCIFETTSTSTENNDDQNSDIPYLVHDPLIHISSAQFSETKRDLEIGILPKIVPSPLISTFSMGEMDGITPFRFTLSYDHPNPQFVVDDAFHVDTLTLPRLLTIDLALTRYSYAKPVICFRQSIQKEGGVIDDEVDAIVSVNLERGTEISFNESIRKSFNDIQTIMTCPDFSLLSHYYDDSFLVQVYQKLRSMSQDPKVFGLVETKTLSPYGNGNVPRPITPDIESISYTMRLQHGVTAITLQMNSDLTTYPMIWDDIAVKLVLFKVTKGDIPVFKKCEIRAFVYVDEDEDEDGPPDFPGFREEIENTLAITFFESFPMNYYLDESTQFLILEGTLPVYGLRNPNIVCWIDNSDSNKLEVDWTQHQYRTTLSANTVVGKQKLSIDPNYYPNREEKYGELEIHDIDGKTPLGFTIRNLRARQSISFVDYPMFILDVNAPKTDEPTYTVECALTITKESESSATTDTDTDTDTGTGQDITETTKIQVDVSLGSIFGLVFDEIVHPGLVKELTVICPTILLESHYFDDSFVVSVTGAHIALRSFVTTKTMKTVIGPKRPTPPTPDPNPDDPVTSGVIDFYLFSFITTTITVLCVIILSTF